MPTQGPENTRVGVGIPSVQGVTVIEPFHDLEGVPDAARWIKTGDTITVDAHLGTVIIGELTLSDSYSKDIDPST